MTPNFIKLDSEKHRLLKLTDVNNYAHIEKDYLAPVTFHEFIMVGAAMPIVFIPTGSGKSLRPVAMMGLKEGENLMLNEDKGWDAIIIPESASIYPFGLTDDETAEDKAVLSFDEHNERFHTEGEGKPLFNEDGSPSKFHVEAKAFVKKHWDNMQTTMAITKQFEEKGLLKPFGVSLNLGDDQKAYAIDGFHIFDEEKLKELPVEEFDGLRKRGYLPAIYAQLSSLQQFNNLARRKTGK